MTTRQQQTQFRERENAFQRALGIGVADQPENRINTPKNGEKMNCTGEVPYIGGETSPETHEKLPFLVVAIPGQPVAKGRPKTSTRGGYVKLYTPKKTTNYEKRVAEFASIAMRAIDQKPAAKPLKMILRAYFAIPKSWSKKKQKQAMCGELHHVVKPDFDNVLKSVTDGLNAVAFIDDKQIVGVAGGKFYSTSPRVVVELWEL